MCQHLKQWKERHKSNASFGQVQRTCLRIWQAKQSSIDLKGVACMTCGCGCNDEAWFRQHASQTGHHTGLNFGSLSLYCSLCQDTVYDTDFDAAVMGAATLAKQGINGGVEVGKPSLPGVDWVQECAESHLQRRSSGDDAGPSSDAALRQQTREAGGGDGMPAGLRGLVNLGNTCFMSTVLHSLLHAPPMRAFYLGGGHPNLLCSRAPLKPCLSCELDGIFSAAYCGERRPYSPASFLAAWWHHADSLSGYQQQDAHEFFMFALSGLEGSKVAATPTPSATSPAPGIKREGGLPSNTMAWNGGTFPEPFREPRTSGGAEAERDEAGFQGDRQASPAPRLNDQSATSASTELLDGEGGIVEHTFGGMLRSDVTCASCGYTSTVHEDFLALSLDIDPAPGPPLPLLRPSPVQPAPVAKNGKRLVGAAATASAKAARKRARTTPASALASQIPNEAATEMSSCATPASTETSGMGTVTDVRGASPTPPPNSAGAFGGTSSLGAGSGIVAGLESPRDETVSSPPRAPSPPSSQELWTGASPPAKQKGPKAKNPASAKPPKAMRCGQCYTCKNKQLKKACQRNVELKRLAEDAERGAQSLLPMVEAPSPAVAAAAELHLPAACHESAQGQAPQDATTATDRRSTASLPSGSSSGCINGSGPPAQGVTLLQTSSMGVGGPSGLTLTGCLRRYVRPETLAKWHCEKCEQRAATKQLSVRRLPQVLCLHLKRFQHPGSQAAAHKLDTLVSYPTYLDMQPFVTASILKQRYTRQMHPPAASAASEAASVYELYAVVCHLGKIQGGHYIVFLKCSSKWFECNDHRIDEVSEAVACSSQAYMLFYRLVA